MADIEMLAAEVGIPLLLADIAEVADVPVMPSALDDCDIEIDELPTEVLDTNYEEEIPELSVPDTDNTASTNNGRKRHRQGKVEMVFVGERVARRDCFFKRKTGLLKKAKELAILTGAQVSLRIVNSDTRKVYQYYSDPTLKPSQTKRHVRCQVREECFTQVNKSLTSLSTPTKSMPLPTSAQPPSSQSSSEMVVTPIQGLPGKKSVRTPPARSVNNKCKVCHVIYNCKQDKMLQKEHGKQNAWIGCDNDKCQYWVHARCVGIKLPTRGKVTNMPFLCPQHTT